METNTELRQSLILIPPAQPFTTDFDGVTHGLVVVSEARSRIDSRRHLGFLFVMQLETSESIELSCPHIASEKGD